MASRYYTGIGSRQTPPEVLQLMTQIAHKLELAGLILRSGGAVGADLAFEHGVKDDANKSIYYASDATQEAIDLASNLHPAWYRCSDYARKLHGRNCMQVLGANLDTPSRFVICWTPNAQVVGGTATAIALAKQRGIKVYNLANQKVRQWFADWLNK